MLVVKIPITMSSVDAIKSHLRRALPEVKSSHRVEAAARGLGFRTYAAMRAAARSDNPTFAEINSDHFVSYLSARGQDVHTIHIYRAVARVALTTVMNCEQRLSIHGYGFGQPRWMSDQERWQTPAERHKEFTKARAKFLSDPVVDEFLRALAFVDRIPSTKTIRSGAGSYRLKHLAENMPVTLPDGSVLGPHYVSNGALIAAALHAGFKMKHHIDHLGYDHINVTFNMPKTVVDDLDCELRPHGGLAQHRAWLASQRRGWRLR